VSQESVRSVLTSFGAAVTADGAEPGWTFRSSGRQVLAKTSELLAAAPDAGPHCRARGRLLIGALGGVDIDLTSILATAAEMSAERLAPLDIDELESFLTLRTSTIQVEGVFVFGPASVSETALPFGYLRSARGSSLGGEMIGATDMWGEPSGVAGAFEWSGSVPASAQSDNASQSTGTRPDSITFDDPLHRFWLATLLSRIDVQERVVRFSVKATQQDISSTVLAYTLPLGDPIHLPSAEFLQAANRVATADLSRLRVAIRRLVRGSAELRPPEDTVLDYAIGFEALTRESNTEPQVRALDKLGVLVAPDDTNRFRSFRRTRNAIIHQGVIPVDVAGQAASGRALLLRALEVQVSRSHE
jgi:hypothetical protein